MTEMGGREGVREEHIFGTKIALLDVPAAAAAIMARPADAPFAYIVTPNAQHLVQLDRGDADFRAAYDGAWLRLCDSQIVRLVARLFFARNLPLCAGSDLTAALFADHIRPDDRICVIGGDAELERRLREKYGLRNLARHAPPMGFMADPEAVQACIDFIEAHPSRFVFLAVGSPRSELLACRVRARGRATGTGLCIGSSLHFITGLVPRAPLWMRRLALEWLFRLLRAPRSHARRVFVDSLPFLYIALRQRLMPGRRSGLPPEER